tara:strand:- start:41 stop:382 length:342 start_codon:yes stop_codon:yes gene_type:complete
MTSQIMKKGEDEYYRKLHQEKFDYRNYGMLSSGHDELFAIVIDDDEDGIIPFNHKGHPILVVEIFMDVVLDNSYAEIDGSNFSRNFFANKGELDYLGIINGDANTLPCCYYYK